jgi:hypothetical protein
MNELEQLQKKLKSLADTVNLFQNEAVQLRVLEILLSTLGSISSVPANPVEKIGKRPAGRGRRKTQPARDDAKPSAKKREPRKPGRSAPSPGAHAMISQLLTEGFFRTGRTIGAIIEHAGTSRGHHYKANECSPALLRLLRDGKLTRKKNKDKQYEYTQA